MERTYGISENLNQFCQQLAQIFFVGMTIGMVRTVVPALAESEFNIARDSYLLLTTFVAAFGFAKGAMNFFAGRMCDQYGRRRILLIGWLFALPAPVMILLATEWNDIVWATLLLGINQGFCWSAAQTSKIDLAGAKDRGFAVGLNEFGGYSGVAIAGIATGYLATDYSPQMAIGVFGMTCVVLALALVLLFVRETLPWAAAEQADTGGDDLDTASAWDVFAHGSWRDSRLFALTQAGLVEKFVDTLVWVFYPAYLYTRGVSLLDISWIVGIYGMVWGLSQFFTGKLSDRIGRLIPCVAGMWICGVGVLLPLGTLDFTVWAGAAVVTGFGMALLYPNLSAAVVDLSAPALRGNANGTYRFWRDLGYGFGAIGLGLVPAYFGFMESGFYAVAVSMFLSGIVLLALGPRRGAEPRPVRVR